MRTNLNQHFKSIAPELDDAALFYGMYSRLARRLGVSPQHVRQVSIGKHKSKRVRAAILREVARIRKASLRPMTLVEEAELLVDAQRRLRALRARRERRAA
jgi:DNA-binding transcriptional regulator YdaS (Cro superfamily)